MAGSPDFKVISEIQHVETFARGSGIREVGRLRKLYGHSRWRKRKGIATVKLLNGTVRQAESHWYEAQGTGKLELKIKLYLD